MGADLLLRYLIITVAAHVACAWIQTFQSPWPLVDAFQLAGTAEEQLFQSLGVRFDSLPIIQILLKLLLSNNPWQYKHSTWFSSPFAMKEMLTNCSECRVPSS